MRILHLTLLLLTFFVLVFPLACERKPQTLTLGYIGVMSGRSSGLGIDGRDGFLLALHEANHSGGVNGKELEALVLDSGQGTGHYDALINRLKEAGAVAAVGPMRSQVASSLIPLANEASLVLLSPTVSSDAFSGKDDYFLRNYYSNRQAAQGMARLVAQRGLKKVAVLFNVENRAYTEDYLKNFRTAFQEYGGTIVEALPFSSLDMPNYLQIAQPMESIPSDGVLLLANAVDTAMLCQQFSKLNVTRPIFTTPWSFTDDLIAFGGRAVEGVTLLLSIDPQSTQPAFVTFRRSFMDAYGREPRFSAIHAYDATRLLIEALRRTQGSQGLKESLLGLGEFSGLQNPIRLDAYGDLDAPTLYPVHIQGGEFRVVAEQ